MTTEADAAAGTEPPLTKRARREKLKKSDKNRWPQHPNIRNPEQRAKAYVRTAGLLKPKETPNLPLEDPSTIKLGRLLGGTDQRARHSAVLQLRAYLTARSDIEKGGISEMDLLKLWKGLWYTLYMADKAPVQEELSSHIANLIWCFEGTEEEDEYAAAAYMDLTDNNSDEYDGADGENDDDSESDDSYEVSMEEISNTLNDGVEEEDSDDDEGGDGDQQPEGDEQESNSSSKESDSESGMVEDDLDDSEIRHCRGAHLASLFLRTYFATLRREWGNMDKYRIDKFYTLTRFLLQECFKYMAKRHWSLGIIRLFNDTIFEEVLSKTPNGIRFHLIDITIEELAAVNANAPMPLTEATFLDCVEPYFGLLQTSEPTVHNRVIEKIMKKFLDDHSVLSDTYLKAENDEDKKLIFDQVHVGTVAKFIFDVASDGTTSDFYRKKLYSLNKMFYRRLKKVGKDVPLDDHPEDEEELVHSKDDFQPQSDLAEEMDQLETHEDEVQQAEVGRDEHTDEKRKQKKKKKKKKNQKGSGNRVDEPKEASSEVAQEESKQKKKKTQSGSDEKAEEVNKDSAVAAQEQSNSFEGEKKKRKRTKKNQSPSNHDDIVGQSEEITISIQDQLKAKRALDKASDDQLKKKRKASSEDSSSDGKRVKFGKMNLFRSWKASMKGLRDMIVPPSRVTSPEKGILRNKKVTAPRNSKIQKRKKAIDYFK